MTCNGNRKFSWFSVVKNCRKCVKPKNLEFQMHSFWTLQQSFCFNFNCTGAIMSSQNVDHLVQLDGRIICCSNVVNNSFQSILFMTSHLVTISFSMSLHNSLNTLLWSSDFYLKWKSTLISLWNDCSILCEWNACFLFLMSNQWSVTADLSTWWSSWSKNLKHSQGVIWSIAFLWHWNQHLHHILDSEHSPSIT